MCSSCLASSQQSVVPPWSSPYLSYCPTCNAYIASPNYNYAMQPWWMNQAPNYWNFYGPGPYNGYGMMPQYFPMPNYQPFNNPSSHPVHQGPGGVYMAKPVLYLRGPADTKIEVLVDEGGTPKDKHELLVAVPALKHSKKGASWSATINGKTLKTENGDYEFFFYDSWATDSIFQDQEGYCSNRKEVLEYMRSGLKQRGFPENSIQDFDMTWGVKLPYNQNLCVYPQTEKQLQQGTKLTFTPAVELIQLEYVVVPKSFFARPEAKQRERFKSAPEKDFVDFKKTSEIANREVASSKDKPAVTAYDWGVGFMRVQGTEHQEPPLRKPDSEKK